jgi:hypothetical protein
LRSPPTPGIDDCHVHAGGHVGKRVREDERALEDVLGRDTVRDVDDVRVGRNALDHASTGTGEVVLDTEIR